MTRLVLVAASAMAREVIALEQLRGAYDDLALVDDDPLLWDTTVDGVRVLGGLDRAAEGHADLVVCAGSGVVRRRLVTRLAALGVAESRYPPVIHPDVRIPASCTVGAGSILFAGVVLTAAVRVGRHVVAMPQVTLTHDDVVDDYATLCAGVSLAGGVRVGEAAYLGMNACVRQGAVVGAEATLGMGAALLDDLPPGETWAGVPAAALARREELVR